MKLGDEALKTVRATHLLGMAVAAAALVLLVSPFEADFRDALREAHLLKEAKSVAPFEDFARKAITASFADPDFLPSYDGVDYVGSQLVLFIDRQLGACCVGPIAPIDWSVTHAIDYEPRPIGRPLEAWSSWTGLKAPIRYWKPDWATASLSLDTWRQKSPTEQDSPCELVCPPARIRTLRFFEVRPSVQKGDSWSRIPTYRFLAFLEQGLVRPQARLKGPAWWREVSKLPREKLLDRAWQMSLRRAGRSVVEGVVSLSNLTACPGETGSISEWLRYDSASRAFFEMPHLKKHWSHLEKKTLSEAIAYMEKEQKRMRDMSLVGISIPGQLCVVAIPLAFLLSHLYLFLHLRACTQTLTTASERPQELFPWIGLYKERLAWIVTTISLTLVPMLATGLLILKCHPRLGLESTLPAAVLGAGALIFGCLTAIQAAALRREWWRLVVSQHELQKRLPL